MAFAVERLMWSSYGHGFSITLQALREGRKISQQALADITGLSRNQISNLERNDHYGEGLADPRLSTIYKLALGLEVPPASLLPGAARMVEEICALDGEDDWTLLVKPEHIAPFPSDYVNRRRFSGKWAFE